MRIANIWVTFKENLEKIIIKKYFVFDPKPIIKLMKHSWMQSNVNKFGIIYFSSNSCSFLASDRAWWKVIPGAEIRRTNNHETVV